MFYIKIFFEIKRSLEKNNQFLIFDIYAIVSQLIDAFNLISHIYFIDSDN